MSTAQSEARAESCEADRPDFNRDTIHAHISILHRLAKLSAADGVLVLACYGENPNTGRELRAQVQRFEIGDIDLMVETIMGFELQPHQRLCTVGHLSPRPDCERARGHQ
jgi:hypothetical protein